MKTFYVCEVCGNASADQQKIARCEQQGRRSTYEKGQGVIFTETSEKTCETTLQGVITGIQFKLKTHAPTYEVVSRGKKYRINEGRIRGLAH